MICFGHRGAAGHAPENTLLSIEKAISLGVDWVEVDVYSVGNELVVIHDDRLERTTNGNGYVLQHSLEYLRSLDAGEGQKIPFLREIIDLVNCRVGINIELKGPNTAAAVAALIEHYITNYGWNYEQFLVSSFNHHQLRSIKRVNPHIQTGALIVALPLNYARFAEELNAFSVHPSIEFIDQSFVDDAHHRGLKVFVFTINCADDLVKMQALGVDGIFTDYPDLMGKK